MLIRAVVFDIGGVLEIVPYPRVSTRWEQRLNLSPGELDQRLESVWKAGSLGLVTEHEVHERIGVILKMSESQVEAFMDDIWQEYLGSPNVELVEFFRSLRPQFQTAILSKSFVGACEKEQLGAAYPS